MMEKWDKRKIGGGRGMVVILVFLTFFAFITFEVIFEVIKERRANRSASKRKNQPFLLPGRTIRK